MPGKEEIVDVIVSQTLPIILLLLSGAASHQGEAPSTLTESIWLSVTSTRPSSCQCCVGLNLSCLPDDLISVNRIIVKYFGVMELWCDALLWHWWHIQLAEANVAVVFFHSSLHEWSAHCRPHDIQSKCHTHLNNFQAGVIPYRLQEAGDLPWVADQKI